MNNKEQLPHITAANLGFPFYRLNPSSQDENTYVTAFQTEGSDITVKSVPFDAFIKLLKEKIPDIAIGRYSSPHKASLSLVFISLKERLLMDVYNKSSRPAYFYDEEAADPGKWNVTFHFSPAYGSDIVPEVITEAYRLAEEADTEVTAHVVTASIDGLETTAFDLKMPDNNIPMDIVYGEGFEDWHTQIVTKMKATTGGILLSHGPPGTGKTTWIRQLVRDLGRDKMSLFVTRSIARDIGSPHLATLLISLAKQHKGIVLVIEDAEHMLLKREASDPAGSDMVSLILNMTDGLMNDLCRCQVIATFNTDASKIDSALLRKGRLISNRIFGPLSVPDAKRLAEHVGKDPNQITKPTILADILSDEIVSAPAEAPKGRTGF